MFVGILKDGLQQRYLENISNTQEISSNANRMFGELEYKDGVSCVKGQKGDVVEWDKVQSLAQAKEVILAYKPDAAKPDLFR